MAFTSLIDSVNKDRVAFAAGPTAPAAAVPLATIIIERAGKCQWKQEAARRNKSKKRTMTTTTATERRRRSYRSEQAVPQVRFSHPAVSSLARDCDQWPKMNVRTAEQERDSAAERKRRIENWSKRERRRDWERMPGEETRKEVALQALYLPVSWLAR